MIILEAYDNSKKVIYFLKGLVMYIEMTAQPLDRLSIGHVTTDDHNQLKPGEIVWKPDHAARDCHLEGVASPK